MIRNIFFLYMFGLLLGFLEPFSTLGHVGIPWEALPQTNAKFHLCLTDPETLGWTLGMKTTHYEP